MGSLSIFHYIVAIAVIAIWLYIPYCYYVILCRLRKNRWIALLGLIPLISIIPLGYIASSRWSVED